MCDQIHQSSLVYHWYFRSFILTHISLNKMVAISADGISKCIFLNENNRISIQISLKAVSMNAINNKPALVQAMAWRRTCDKPFSEQRMTQSTDAYMRHWANLDITGMERFQPVTFCVWLIQVKSLDCYFIRSSRRMLNFIQNSSYHLFCTQVKCQNKSVIWKIVFYMICVEDHHSILDFWFLWYLFNNADVSTLFFGKSKKVYVMSDLWLCQRHWLKLNIQRSLPILSEWLILCLLDTMSSVGLNVAIGQ